MRFSTVFTSLLVGVATAAPFTEEVQYWKRAEEEVALLRRQIPSLPCSHTTGGLHVIALGGANTDNFKDYGYLGSLSRSILNAIPGSTNVSLPYNKTLISQAPPKLSPTAVPNGMRLLKQYVVDYHHYCPNTKIALISYSSGGVIMMNDLCYGGSGQGTPQLNPLINGKYIVGSVAYGEETFVPGQPWNRGTCVPGNGVQGGVAPRANSQLCYPYADNLLSFCDAGDPDCCVGSPGQNVNVHFGYPAKYDSQATQHIVQKFKQFGGA